MTRRPTVAVLGATGALGVEVLARLPARLPRAIAHAFASERSAGRDVDGLDVQALSAASLAAVEPDVVIAAVPAPVTLPETTGHVVDLRADAAPTARHTALDGAPAAAIQQLLGCLAPLGAVERVTGTVLTSASARGQASLDELRDQTVALLSFRTPPVQALPRRLAFDLLPGDAARAEAELARACPTVQCQLSTVCVPTFIGIGLDLTLDFDREIDADAVIALLNAADGFTHQAEPAPNLADVVGEDELAVGPVRAEGARLRVWLAFDNLRTTANRVLDAVEAALNSTPD